MRSSGGLKLPWEHIREEMVRKSYLKCGISNKMNGTKDGAETDDGADNDQNADYYDDSPVTHEIPVYSFFADDDNYSDFVGF